MHSCFQIVSLITSYQTSSIITLLHVPYSGPDPGPETTGPVGSARAGAESQIETSLRFLILWKNKTLHRATAGAPPLATHTTAYAQEQQLGLPTVDAHLHNTTTDVKRLTRARMPASQAPYHGEFRLWRLTVHTMLHMNTQFQARDSALTP
jgi:hypothetical protein